MITRSTLFLLFFLTLTTVKAPVPPAEARAELPRARAGDTDPSSLIAAVNDLRASHGLPAYGANPVLMSVAQAHAAYMASIGSVTHYGADGSRPFQRGLAAGYPVAGDLNLGGFYSENIIAGTDLTVYEAVDRWTGDAPHLNTMLSPNLTEIGAGAVDVGGYLYYVIDAARPSGTMPTYIPPGGTPLGGGGAGATAAPVATIVPSTPLTNGSIAHVVQPGETLWLIAISYGVKVDDLRSLNQLGTSDVLSVGQTLIVRLASTAAPATITPTKTPYPTATEYATFTQVPSETPSPTPVRAASIAPTVSMSVAAVIVLAALLTAGVVALSTRAPRR